MGTLKKHIQGTALDRFACIVDGSKGNAWRFTDLPRWYDVNGNARTSICMGASTSGTYKSQWHYLNKYMCLVGYASAETIDNFDYNSYTKSDIAGVTYARGETDNIASHTYNITITNKNSSAVTVNSVKFTKSILWADNNTPNHVCESLLWTYYLDNAVTIAPNEVKTISVTFDFTVL